MTVRRIKFVGIRLRSWPNADDHGTADTEKGVPGVEEIHRHEEWKPAEQEFRITLEEVVSGKRKDRKVEAIETAI